MEKLHEYQGWTGRFHEWRDGIREKYTNWRNENPGNVIELIKKATADAVRSDDDQNDYSHIYRFVFHEASWFFIFFFHSQYAVSSFIYLVSM